jgi:hypothetical protein|tara:strand:+ start:174 stop:410 length:237 start_codon:yes stop_codon:yes gene_type:complete
MKKPYFIKHRHELKPREIVNLTDKDKGAREAELLSRDLLLITTTETALRLLAMMGNPLECEIQTSADFGNDSAGACPF